jgi:hypothetical protein
MKKLNIIVLMLIFLTSINVAFGVISLSDVVNSWEFQNDYTDELGNFTLLPSGAIVGFQTTNCFWGTHCLNITSDTGWLTSNFYGYTNPHTIEFWIYPSGWSGVDYNFLLSTNQTNTDSHAEKYSFYYVRSGVAWWLDQVSIPDGFKGLNQWQHIIIAYDNTNMKYYINGALNYTFGMNTAPSSSVMFFHHSTNVDRGFNGLVSAIRIYNRKLGQIDVTELYNSGGGLRYSDFGDVPSVNFFSESPVNGTGINKTTLLYYTLSNIYTNAQCTLFKDGITIASMIDLSNGTYTFNFNSTVWSIGANNLNVTCNSSTYINFTEGKEIFVDVTEPTITYTNPPEFQYFNNLQNLTINISTNDTNNYLFNFTINRAGYDDVLYNNYTINISTDTHNFSETLNFSNNYTGWYSAKVWSYDAHTKNKIDFSKNLIEKEYLSLFNRGLDIDTIRTYSPRLQINKFDTLQEQDRKKFYIEFDNNVEEFEINLESNDNIVYLGDSYGYQAHFIIGLKYWYDLENKDNIKVKDVERLNANHYRITLNKDKNLKSTVFTSIGIINSASIERWVYYNNTNITIPASITDYSTAENVTISTTANITNIVKLNIQLSTEILTATISLNSTPTYNLTLDIGVNDSVFEYESITNFTGFLTLPEIKTQLQSLLPACDCTNCTLTATYCSVPIHVRTATDAKITFNNAFIGFNYSSSQINITLLDSITLQPITQNMTIEIVGSNYQASNTTNTSNMSFNVPFASPLGDMVIIRVFMTSGSDYVINSRILDILPSNKYNLTIYMLNISDPTKTTRFAIRVIDQNLGIRVPNARIAVIKQNPSTSKDIIQTEMITNINGEISTYLTTDTVFYKFNVSRDSEVLFVGSYASYPPTPALIVIQVNLFELFDAYYNVLILNHANLSFFNTSNQSGYYILDVNSNVKNIFCLDVYNYSMGIMTLNQSICANVTGASIVSSELSGENLTFIASGSVNYFDGNGKRYLVIRRDDMGISVSEGVNALGTDGIFIAIIVLLVSWFGFIANPYFGIGIFIVGMSIVIYSGMTAFPVSVLAIIISLCVFTLFVISRRRYQ